jgi:hypothetical protein
MKRPIGRVSIGLAAAAVAIVLAAASMRLMGAASSELKPDSRPFEVSQAVPGHDEAPDAMQQHHEMMHMHGDPTLHTPGATPTLAGQDAFGAIQEIVRILEADPTTDWSKVDLESLRQHLIDMNEVTLNADVVQWPVDGGLKASVTGAGRTLAAIQRMVPAHARAINGNNGWRVEAETLPNGVLFTVTSSEAKETTHIRGLGFIGILVRGSHHRFHHLAMARGSFAHGR